jgi:phosphoglycerate dehydrogenase-like enzyme
MRAPRMVYTDLDDGDDPTEGMELLRVNGFEVAFAQSRDPDVIAAAAADAAALLIHPRAITTPHVGFLSDTTDAEYMQRQADAVVSWRANGRPDRAVNRVEVLL